MCPGDLESPIAAYGWRMVPDIPECVPLVARILKRAERVGLGTGARRIWYNWGEGLWLFDMAAGFFITSCEKDHAGFLGLDWEEVVYFLTFDRVCCDV